MEFDRVLRRRAMVRRFTAAPVPEDVVAHIVDAALRAPSAGHSQGVDYLVLTGDDVARFWQLSAGERSSTWLDGMRTAPVLVLVWTSAGVYHDRYRESDKVGSDPFSAPWWWVDAGMGVEAMLLAAVDAGLGACFFGIPPAAQAPTAAAFGVPDDRAAVGVVALGTPHADHLPGRSAARPRRAGRVHHGHW